MWERLVPGSHVTFPEPSFLTYLQVKAVFFGTITSLLQVGYDSDDRGTASAVFQEPRDATEPAT